MPNSWYGDIYGFSGDCVCLRMVKLIEEVTIFLMYFFSTGPQWL